MENIGIVSEGSHTRYSTYIRILYGREAVQSVWNLNKRERLLEALVLPSNPSWTWAKKEGFEQSLLFESDTQYCCVGVWDSKGRDCPKMVVLPSQFIYQLGKRSFFQHPLQCVCHFLVTRECLHGHATKLQLVVMMGVRYAPVTCIHSSDSSCAVTSTEFPQR